MDLLENTTFDQFLMDRPGDLDPPAGDPPPDPNKDKNPENVDDNKPGSDDPNLDSPTGGEGGDDAEAAAKAKAEAEKAAAEAEAAEKEKLAKETTDGDGDQGGDGDEPQIIDLIKENLGYEVEGAFDNSVEGVTEYARKAIPKAAEQMVQQLFEEYPEAQQLINHLSQGNSLETFMEANKVPAHLSQEMTEESLDLQRQVMTEQFLSTGMSEEDAEAFVANLEEQGKLFNTAKAAHEKMKKSFEGEIKAKQEAELAQQEAQRQQATQQWEEIKTMVDAGNLGGITIPQSKQAAFWDYLAKPTDAKNRTARDIKQQNLTLEQRMMIEYMVFSDFKVGTRKTAHNLDSLHRSNSSRENRLKGTAGKQDQPIDRGGNLDGVSLGSLLPQQ